MLVFFTFAQYLSSVGHGAGIGNPPKKGEHREWCQQDIPTHPWLCEPSPSSTDRSEQSPGSLLFCSPQLCEMSCVTFPWHSTPIAVWPLPACPVSFRDTHSGHYQGYKSKQPLPSQASVSKHPWASLPFPGLCFCGSFVYNSISPVPACWPPVPYIICDNFP